MTVELLESTHEQNTEDIIMMITGENECKFYQSSRCEKEKEKKEEGKMGKKGKKEGEANS